MNFVHQLENYSSFHVIPNAREIFNNEFKVNENDGSVLNRRELLALCLCGMERIVATLELPSKTNYVCDAIALAHGSDQLVKRGKWERLFWTHYQNGSSVFKDPTLHLEKVSSISNREFVCLILLSLNRILHKFFPQIQENEKIKTNEKEKQNILKNKLYERLYWLESSKRKIKLLENERETLNRAEKLDDQEISAFVLYSLEKLYERSKNLLTENGPYNKTQ
eukprot:gb/GECH01011727.1/.p1 GENE.gb/GECH01011727.1/~~gb/GECH01011727.1/.p1  ORF type:complete len:223 (+),score=44.33 gb/GECH01011727.1/:1-669(+)